MMISFLRSVAIIGLVFALTVDSWRHFDRELVHAKITNRSGQYHWNLFYPQSHLYLNSPFRYSSDFRDMRTLVEPGSILISDFVTSHYAAVLLPVYIKNTQRHHGRYLNPLAQSFDRLDFCYLNNAERKNRVLSALQQMRREDYQAGRTNRYYLLLNKDRANKNLHQECMAVRHRYIASEINELSTTVYSSELFDLFLLDPD